MIKIVFNPALHASVGRSPKERIDQALQVRSMVGLAHWKAADLCFCRCRYLVQ
jgi:hypothetical protein